MESKKQLSSKGKTMSIYVRERSMMKWRRSREHCFVWTSDVNKSFEVKFHNNKAIIYEVNEIIVLMPPFLRPYFSITTHG